MPDELTLTEREQLTPYYEAAHDDLRELAVRLCTERITNFESLPDDEQSSLVYRAMQDIAIANVPLGTFLSYLDMKSEEAAVMSISRDLLASLSEPERDAVVQEQQLRVLSSTELEVNLVQGALLERIDALGSYAHHPSGYASLGEMAEHAGISASERSDLMALSGIIFPYIENTLGLDPRDLWVRVGKSKFRAIVPILRTLVDSAYDGTQRVRARIDAIRDEVAQQQGTRPTNIANRDVARHVLERAETNTARDLGEYLRGGEREPFMIRAVQVGEQVVVSANITVDDLTLMQRRLDTYAEFLVERDPIPAEELRRWIIPSSE